MTNKNLLKILFVEDLPSDADLAVMELRKEGLKFEHKRVDTRDEFVKTLNEFRPDIVISDNLKRDNISMFFTSHYHSNSIHHLF